LHEFFVNHNGMKMPTPVADHVDNVADGAFDSQLVADVVGTPNVRFGQLSGVVRGATADIDVTVEPSNSPITLKLATTAGTGKAVFGANNSDTLVINQSGTLAIQGVTESNQRDNIRIQATVDGKKVNETDELFSVVWVNLGFRNSGSFSPDNAARTKIIEAIGQDRLGTYRSSGSIPPTVAPKDFQDPVTAESTSTIHSA
jgi:hypothetical protein